MVSKELAPVERLYAIGDVHGHSAKLRAMYEAIARDLEAHRGAGARIVHLGDYVDRGPDSAGCLALLAAGPPVEGVQSVYLMGNHERMMLDALEDDAHVALWLQNGGRETLASFGIAAPLRDGAWRAVISARCATFLTGLPLEHRAERHLFVHAGVRPGIRLAMQSDEDRLWIRDEFLGWPGTMLPDAPGLRIVHGHTPTATPEVKRNRIGIDTNAGRGGPLTCAVLVEDSVYFLQV